MPGDPLLEREAELGELDRAIAAAAAGEGRVVLVEGPAGAGKSALLRAARERAAAAGLATLAATASELDRTFAFGLVHQLLDAAMHGAEPEHRQRLLAGAGQGAAVVFEPAAAPSAPDDPGYTVLHGLYWLVANLAEERPLLLLADDLHWGDRPSLRFLEFLARRIEGLPVLVVAALRPREPGAETALLAALADGPAASVLRPAPLGAPAAGAMLAAALEAAPDPAFVSAAVEATGGNPLLLRTLAREAGAQGLSGTRPEAARVVSLAASGVERHVRRRLDGLGADAAELARAATVITAAGRLDDLAAIAGMDAARARAAADRLAGAELLEPGAWTYVHPAVRGAVADMLSAGERGELHRRAAERLAAIGASPAELAVHLLELPPGRDAVLVETLREAARAAAGSGAPEAGAAYLRRALAEPPDAADVAAVRLELGELEVLAGEPDGAGHLDAALAAGLTGDAAARALVGRALPALLTDPASALDGLERAHVAAAEPALRLRAEAALLEASVFLADLAPRREALLARGREDPEASPAMLAHLAQDAAYRGAPAAETLALARRAWAGGALLQAGGPESNTYILLVHAARYAEDDVLAREMLAAGDAAVLRTGSRFGAFVIEHPWAYWHLSFGSVAAGAGRAEAGLARARDSGFSVSVAAFGAVLAELLVEQDRLDAAAAVVDALPPGLDGTVSGPFAVAARGLVRARQGRTEDAVAELRHSVALLETRGWEAPMVADARLRLARVLVAAGRPGEARTIASSAAARAMDAGLQGALGAALRAEGRATAGDAGIELLERAATTLATTPLRLEHGWAEHDLGAALRRAGSRAAAREPLKRALDAAARCESALLARQARDELAAAGGRADRSVLSGPGALTPSERRVADLAASGETNRRIAESLWVTQKTVEVHLRNAYAKLGIQSRGQLPAALTAAT